MTHVFFFKKQPEEERLKPLDPVPTAVNIEQAERSLIFLKKTWSIKNYIGKILLESFAPGVMVITRVSK